MMSRLKLALLRGLLIGLCCCALAAEPVTTHYDVVFERNLGVSMRDGTILRADVYRQVPTADGWGWQPLVSDDAAVLTTDDLASACLAPLLGPPATG